MKRRNPRRRRTALVPEITLTPLIDTALTLLIIFMMTTPIMQHSINVDLPQAGSSREHEMQDIVVTLSKGGEIQVNEEVVSDDELLSRLEALLSAHHTKPVNVRADQGIEYGRVINLVDRLKVAGVKYVALATRPG